MGSGLAGFLGALAGPLAKRVLAALGLGVVSYAALSALVGQVVAAASAAYGGMTGDVAAIVGLAGLGQAMGIITAAMVARVSFMQLERIGRIAA